MTVSREGSSMLHVLVPRPAVRGDRISHLPSVARIPPAARGRLAFRKSPRRDNRHPVGTLCEGGSGAPDALSHRRKGKPRPGAGRLRSNAISVTRAPYAVPNRLATLALLVSLYSATVASRHQTSPRDAGRPRGARTPRPCCSLDPVRVHVW